MNSHIKAPAPKRHHFLPQCYQKQFLPPDTSRIFVYDRERNAIRHQPVEDTAVIRHFYAVSQLDGTKDTSIENPFLSTIDSCIPQIVADLRARCSFSNELLARIALTAGFLCARVPSFDDGIQNVEGGLIKKISQELWSNEEKIEEWLKERERETGTRPQATAREMAEFFKAGNYTVEISRNRVIQHMLDVAPMIGEILRQHFVLVLHAPPGTSFVTSDRPVSIVAPPNEPQWGGVGFGSPDAYKLFPISHDMIISFSLKRKRHAHVDVDASYVRETNGWTASMMDSYLYSGNRVLIESLVSEHNLSQQKPVEFMTID